MLNEAKKRIKSIPNYVWILLAIVLIGAFLRTYNFHDWLNFRDDQARDAHLVSQVVAGTVAWPLVGPYMSYTGVGDHDESNSFHLGPIYYYFQIISAEMFGDGPDKLAYPDVLFAIFSIPLLYLFLRSYFEKKISISITGLYAISAYFIQYSRFAWNTNLIPFFVLLFLLSLHNFLEKNDKSDWKWPVLLGISIGVGVQLHVIMIAIFLPVTFFVFLLSLKKNIGAWKKWALVVLMICILNLSQIVNELRTNFSNTKILFTSASTKDSEGVANLATSVRNDVDCHVEANAFFLSAYGSSNCTYDFLNPAAYSHQTVNVSAAKKIQDLALKFSMVMALIFSGLGFLLFLRYGCIEVKKNKRNFLYLILFYYVVAFLIMIPLSSSTFKDLRYLTPIFFMPYLLLGFFVKYIYEKISNKYVRIILVAIIFSLLTFSNVATVLNQVSIYVSKNKTCKSHWTALGELESVAEYIISNSNNQRVVNFAGDNVSQALYEPLEYLLKRDDVELISVGIWPKLSKDSGPTYLVTCKDGLNKKYDYGKASEILIFNINK